MQKAPLIAEDLIKVFENWRVHNPQYSLEKELEEKVNELSDLEIEGWSAKISEDADKSIYYRRLQGWENFHIITIGKNYPYIEEFINDIKPIYIALLPTLELVMPDVEFTVLETEDYIAIGFMNDLIKKKFQK